MLLNRPRLLQRCQEVLSLSSAASVGIGCWVFLSKREDICDLGINCSWGFTFFVKLEIRYKDTVECTHTILFGFFFFF